jgi:hypothetical protein
LWRRGNCIGEVPASIRYSIPGAPLKPLRSGQCLLVTDGDLFNIAAGSIWLDSLYIRLKSTERDAYPSLVNVEELGLVWMTGVTMQGDGESECRGLNIRTSAFIGGAKSSWSV